MIGVLVASAAVLGVVNWGTGRHSSPSTPTAGTTQTVPFETNAAGWVLVDGDVRTIVNDEIVARFPDDVAPDVRPVRVADGFVAVTTRSGVSNLWWSNSTDVAYADRLATSVSGVAASEDGKFIAYSEVTPDAAGPTILIVADVITGAERSTAQFPTFARVVGYSGSLVVLETGHGAGAAAAIWTPSTGSITTLPEYGDVGGVGQGFAVLDDGGGSCPVLVAIAGTSVTPQSRPSLDPACSTDRWTLGASADAIGFGIPASPERLRVSLVDGARAVSETRATDAIWVGDGRLAVVDANGDLQSCDIAGHCAAVRVLAPSGASSGAQWLIAPLAKREHNPQPSRSPSTTLPSRSRNVR